MSTTPGQTNGPGSREGTWAKPVDKLKMSGVPAGAINLNVEGRQLTGPVRGFGQMWQKTYRLRMVGARVTPVEVITAWKENFPRFWPKGNRFYPSMSGMTPGEIGVINVAGPGGVPIMSTGIMVIYADDESFSFMTPEGHPMAGLVTFSGFTDEDAVTVAQAQALIRANDPLWELGFRLGFAHKTEDQIWHHSLRSLAAHFGVTGQAVQQQVTCVDPRVQWSEAKNIWQNAGARTAIYTMAAPVRWAKGLLGRNP